MGSSEMHDEDLQGSSKIDETSTAPGTGNPESSDPAHSKPTREEEVGVWLARQGDHPAQSIPTWMADLTKAGKDSDCEENKSKIEGLENCFDKVLEEEHHEPTTQAVMDT